MATVPGEVGGAAASTLQGPKPSQASLMMAAATIAEQGKEVKEAADEKKLREDFSHSFFGNYPARIGDGPVPLGRQFDIFNEEKARDLRGENPWKMSPKQLKEKGY